ncbi:VOC family protein [Actinosynnema sp. NPDC053489]|uniref:VOC family protein n=1 Tax=Actinosynnema sp. NPDC053489 TaxID=3363916 RepID=UPI0037CB6A46
MASRLNPYVHFAGNAREALEFYESVFGGTLRISTSGEYGQADAPEAGEVVHGQLETPGGYTLMCADTPPGMPHNPGDTISISLSGDDADELRGYWSKLSGGGTVTVPLERQAWGDEFGSCQDRFGIRWVVDIAGS